jgi:sugar O-acyltransferase (sialic acid O-acetyltransferase NeuD family)
LTGTPLLLLGAGGHARVCIDVIEQEGTYTVGGLIGLQHEVGTRVLGYPVVGTDSDLPHLLRKYGHVLVCVGQIKTSGPRVRLYRAVKAGQCMLPTIVSPRAYVSRHARIGEGTLVVHGAVVNAGAVIGSNCILNSHSLVEHDAVIGDHCHISTSAAVNSGVHIGAGTFVGSNSSIRQGLTLGERCLIGMGQRVLRNCEDETWLPPRKTRT